MQLLLYDITLLKLNFQNTLKVLTLKKDKFNLLIKNIMKEVMLQAFLQVIGNMR